MDEAAGNCSSILRDTVVFFLSLLIRELREEIDLRAKGAGRNLPSRIIIYIWALLRDLARIPLHDPRGIGQARFRRRVVFIQHVAIPSLEFFRRQYPFAPEEVSLLDAALGDLRQGETLLRGGVIPSIDEWYATMDEFRALTDECHQASEVLDRLVIRLSSGNPSA
jgi:hypothetical protein